MQIIPPRLSLVTHSVQHMRGALLRGEWQGFLPSERTLCARLGISRPTLRQVLLQLEQEGLVGAVQSKKRVVTARAEANDGELRRRAVALLSPVPQQAMPPFVLYWLDALRQLLADAGYQLDVQVSSHCFAAKPASALRKMVRRVPAAVWLLFRSTPVMQRWFVGEQLPVVIAGTCAEGVKLPSVDIDYRAACRHATALLLKQGHRGIALLLPEAAHGGDLESECGFREALSVSKTSALVMRHRESTVQVVDCLEEVLQLRPAPTAFLVARSTHALTVITHLLRRGYRVPGDVAVISRDDDAFLDHVVPRFTRYSSDPAKYARRLARLVLELAQTGRTSTVPVRLMPDLCRRETA